MTEREAILAAIKLLERNTYRAMQEARELLERVVAQQNEQGST